MKPRGFLRHSAECRCQAGAFQLAQDVVGDAYTLAAEQQRRGFELVGWQTSHSWNRLGGSGERSLEEGSRAYLREADDVDAAEDRLYGERKPGRVPAELAEPQKRLEAIRKAKASYDINLTFAGGDGACSSIHRGSHRGRG